MRDVFLVEALDHEDRRTFGDHVVHNRLARLKVRRRKRSSHAVQARGVTEGRAFSHQDESAFGAADLERKFQDLLERGVRREKLFPLVLKIEKARNFFEVGIFGRQDHAQVH